MKSLILITNLFLLFSLQLFSQYEEGGIITNDNDTIIGFIRVSDNVSNPKICEFKLNKDDKAIIYKPGEIKSFQFSDNGRYFISMPVLLEDGYKTVFLEWLVKGRVDLLCYTKNSKTKKYYIILENDSIYELKNTRKQFIKNGRVFESKRKEYIGVLIYHLNDCPSINKTIGYSSFSSNSFIKIAKEYHEKTCDSVSCVVYASESSKIRFSLGLMTNTYTPDVRLNSGRPEEIYADAVYGFGLSLQISNLSFISNRLQLNTGFTYGKNIFYYNPESLYYNGDEKLLEYKSFKIPFQFSFSILKGNITPYISAGFTTNIRFGYEDYSDLLINYATSYFEYNMGVSLLQVGYSGAIGMRWAFLSKYAFNLEVYYEGGGRFFNTYIDDNSELRSLMLQGSLVYNLY